MKSHVCPTDDLPLLIQDELSPEQSGEIMEHLEECSSCQSELQTLAADATWWGRAAQGLSGVAVDSRGELPKPDVAVCDVEALLESNRPNDSAMDSSTDVSAMLDPPSHQDFLGRIDEFDIEEKIGQGGMGVVFRGFDRSLNRPVAIKVMAPHLGANGVARKRFAREAQAAAAVVHPHVVPIFRVNASPERPYIAMALVEGRSLQDHVAENGPLEIRDVVRVSLQISEGLTAAHRQGLIHRDIKPANILMEKDLGRVMITDFGLARAVDDVAMTQSGCLAGTPHYMSPEQVTGAELDHRTDLFSLGSVMYFAATGCEPFRAEGAFAVINKITRDDPRRPQSLNAEIPETLNRIIGRLLEKTPRNRIESAAELRQILTQYLAHLQDPTHHSQPQVKATRAERAKVIKRFGWGLSAIGVVVTGLFLGQYFSAGSGLDAGHKSSNEVGGIRQAGDGPEHGSEEHTEKREKQGDGDSRRHR